MARHSMGIYHIPHRFLIVLQSSKNLKDSNTLTFLCNLQTILYASYVSTFINT